MIGRWLGGLVLLGACACNAQTPSVMPPGPSAAARVIALAPHATELVFAVGAGGRLVGVVAGSDYPTPALNLPIIGDSVRLDRERILALAPDLAIAWSSGNREEDLRWLARQGVELYRSDPHRLEDIADDLLAVGALTGNRASGRLAADAFRSRLNRLAEQYGAARPLRAFYALWPQPLMTVGGTSLISQAMKTCGFENLFATLRVESLRVSRESLVATRPEVILLPQPAPALSTADVSDSGRWPGAAPTLVPVEADLIERPGPRMLDAIEQLCRARTEMEAAASGD